VILAVEALQHPEGVEDVQVGGARVARLGGGIDPLDVLPGWLHLGHRRRPPPPP